MRSIKGIINLANLRTMFGYLLDEIEFTANEKSLSTKARGENIEKFVEKRLTLDKNLLWAKYFHKMAHHQTTTDQTKINELKIILRYKYELMTPSKGIINLANLRTKFDYLFEKIEFTASVSMHNNHVKISHILYMHSSFFCHLLICHRSINACNCSKYCN